MYEMLLKMGKHKYHFPMSVHDYSHICWRLIGINSFTCLLYLHETDGNRLQTEEMNSVWVRNRNLGALFETPEKTGDPRKEEEKFNKQSSPNEGLKRD